MQRLGLLAVPAWPLDRTGCGVHEHGHAAKRLLRQLQQVATAAGGSGGSRRQRRQRGDGGRTAAAAAQRDACRRVQQQRCVCAMVTCNHSCFDCNDDQRVSHSV